MFNLDDNLGHAEMEKGEDMSAYKARIISTHIGQCLSRFTSELPMIVGMQGPQGSGKTTTTDKVKERLSKEGVKVAVFSLDDLYKPHEQMLRLGKENSSNLLLQGRGQPGTHDMELGTRIFKLLRGSPPGSKVSLPVYDKSLYNGQGDRSASTVEVTIPLDVVIFEGWCMGFYPISQMVLQQRYHQDRSREEERTWTDPEKDFFFRSHSLKSLMQINTLLESYLDWYRHIDAFIQLRPDNLQNVFAWRLQAEHAMKAAGKDGMTDEQVHSFVARYMPGYELFGEGVMRTDAPWSGKGLQITINAERDVVDTVKF